MNATSNEGFGRVADDGTVYVRTRAGERAVGSWQVGDPAGALAFFGRKYDALVLEVDLLGRRLASGALKPDDAAAAIRRVRRNVESAHAVGDLDGLLERLEGLQEQINQRRQERRERRRRELDEARSVKEGIAVEAETLAAGQDWRSGVNRFRELLDRWKSLPRLDRPTDDALWHRFSSARTAYTRRRKQHFAEQAARREDARAVKERLAAEAETLSTSTDWSGTAQRYRSLMRDWKAAGPAPRAVDDQLWKRFRQAQDRFFDARNESLSARNAEEQENRRQKEELLAEAEALVPVQDHRAARAAFGRIVERWEQVGRVPRDAVREIEGRLHKVEETIRRAEGSEWRRTNPETRARAQDTVAQLRSSLDELEERVARARERGDDTSAQQLQDSLSARQTWLAEAEKTLDELTG